METYFGVNSLPPASQNFQHLRQFLGDAADSCVDLVQRYMASGAVVPLLGAVGAISLGAAAVYYSSSTPSTIDGVYSGHGYLQIEPMVDLKKQSVEVPNSGGARVSALIGKNKKLQERMFDDVTTLYEGFRRGARVSKNGPCLGYRNKGTGPFEWLSYNESIDRSEKLARGFIANGLKPGQTTFVGIYSQNRPEWILTEQACYYYSMVIVPLYDTLGPDTCSYIIDHTQIELVIVDKSSKAESLLAKRDQCRSLRVIVLIEKVDGDQKLIDTAARQGVKIITFAELERMGVQIATKRSTPQSTPPKAHDLSTIAYTSGTTGLPKGVMLTHANIVADCVGFAVLKYSVVGSSDIMMSFLPLAHMFERLLEAIMYSVGGSVGFYSGDIKTLSDDMKHLKPTLIPVVPRLLNRVYDKVMQEASHSRIKKFMIDRAVQAKVAELNKCIIRNNSYWDKLVFKRVRQGMGGNVRLMICGSAPCSEEILTFIRAALGCIVLEGYGQTECVAPCTVTMEGDHIPGHVGPPIPCCQMKLVDVADMNYYARDGKGEVCIKGANVFKGYYKDPEKTAETIDADGWLHTGDIGRWTETGTLQLIDRKKHIFKLAQGEYIAPEKIENVYTRSRFIGQIYVHGESLKSCLIAVVSPDPDVLPKFAADELGIRGSMVELCKNQTIKQLILDDMTAEGKKHGLQSFEQVKDVYLYPELFTVEAGLLTPTMKSKRMALKDFFNKELNRMYSKLV